MNYNILAIATIFVLVLVLVYMAVYVGDKSDRDAIARQRHLDHARVKHRARHAHQ